MIVFSFPEQQELAGHLGFEQCEWQWRQFPDGESYVRVLSDVKGREVAILCSLNQPDAKTLPLLFLAATLKKWGAAKITLIAPYLAYMRQDKAFNCGEAVTSDLFAALLSPFIDALITIDPHLHRHTRLTQIYSCDCKALSAAPLMAEWIKTNITNAVIIGPDAESEQWVKTVATLADAPYVVLQKNRLGDREVQIQLPDIATYKNHVPVLVDDIISTAGTMIKTVTLLQAQSFATIICLATHALFAGDAYEALVKAGAAKIVTTNTVKHQSNGIAIASLFKKSLH
jgi:ribose-phosphate pyrophosphokinase